METVEEAREIPCTSLAETNNATAISSSGLQIQHPLFNEPTEELFLEHLGMSDSSCNDGIEPTSSSYLSDFSFFELPQSGEELAVDSADPAPAASGESQQNKEWYEGQPKGFIATTASSLLEAADFQKEPVLTLEQLHHMCQTQENENRMLEKTIRETQHLLLDEQELRESMRKKRDVVCQELDEGRKELLDLQGAHKRLLQSREMLNNETSSDKLMIQQLMAKLEEVKSQNQDLQLQVQKGNDKEKIQLKEELKEQKRLLRKYERQIDEKTETILSLRTNLTEAKVHLGPKTSLLVGSEEEAPLLDVMSQLSADIELLRKDMTGRISCSKSKSKRVLDLSHKKCDSIKARSCPSFTPSNDDESCFEDVTASSGSSVTSDTPAPRVQDLLSDILLNKEYRKRGSSTFSKPASVISDSSGFAELPLSPCKSPEAPHVSEELDLITEDVPPSDEIVSCVTVESNVTEYQGREKSLAQKSQPLPSPIPSTQSLVLPKESVTVSPKPVSPTEVAGSRASLISVKQLPQKKKTKSQSTGSALSDTDSSDSSSGENNTCDSNKVKQIFSNSPANTSTCAPKAAKILKSSFKAQKLEAAGSLQIAPRNDLTSHSSSGEGSSWDSSEDEALSAARAPPKDEQALKSSTKIVPMQAPPFTRDFQAALFDDLNISTSDDGSSSSDEGQVHRDTRNDQLLAILMKPVKKQQVESYQKPKAGEEPNSDGRKSIDPVPSKMPVLVNSPPPSRGISTPEGPAALKKDHCHLDKEALSAFRRLSKPATALNPQRQNVPAKTIIYNVPCRAPALPSIFRPQLPLDTVADKRRQAPCEIVRGKRNASQMEADAGDDAFSYQTKARRAYCGGQSPSLPVPQSTCNKYSINKASESALPKPSETSLPPKNYRTQGQSRLPVQQLQRAVAAPPQQGAPSLRSKPAIQSGRAQTARDKIRSKIEIVAVGSGENVCDKKRMEINAQKTSEKIKAEKQQQAAFPTSSSKSPYSSLVSKSQPISLPSRSIYSGSRAKSAALTSLTEKGEDALMDVFTRKSGRPTATVSSTPKNHNR